jgi:hypothetical protein
MNTDLSVAQIVNEYGFNSKEAVGDIKRIFMENHFKTYEEYVEYYEENVHTMAELEKLVFERAVRLGFEGIKKKILDFVMKLVFPDSWEGYQREEAAKLWLRKNGFQCVMDCERVLPSLDSTYNIDFYAGHNGLPYIIQVKTTTYKSYERNYAKNHDNPKLGFVKMGYKKNIKFLRKYPELRGIIYIYFDKNLKYAGRCAYTLAQLENMAE